MKGVPLSQDTLANFITEDVVAGLEEELPLLRHACHTAVSEEQLTMCIIICAVNDSIYLSVSKVTFTVVDECTYQLTVPQRSEIALLPKQ